MSSTDTLRILFALPGLHRYERGAEVAFTSLAAELARTGDEVTLIGSGEGKNDQNYTFLHAGSIRRERFERLPRLPLLRGDTVYEEATFLPALLSRYDPSAYDVTLTCSYPFTNWALRRPRKPRRPAHIFVTQNGDWPAVHRKSEYRFFGCEGLVCTNPDYFEANRQRWRSALIPNGIEIDRFGLGAGERGRFGLPESVPIVLMVSALIPSKRVVDGIRAVARLRGVHLVCAGDGPLRSEVDEVARDLLPNRFTRLLVKTEDMPALYRSANAFLHLSKNESFGNVYIEALACGLPVVAHDVRRVRWIVGGDELLVDTDDEAQLTVALEAALRSPQERAAARVEQAANFAWSNVALRYRAFAREIVGEWRRR